MEGTVGVKVTGNIEKEKFQTKSFYLKTDREDHEFQRSFYSGSPNKQQNQLPNIVLFLNHFYLCYYRTKIILWIKSSLVSIIWAGKTSNQPI